MQQKKQQQKVVPKTPRPSKRAGNSRKANASGRKNLEKMGSDSRASSYLGSRRTVVENREFVTDVLSNTTFTVTTLDINAGIESSFPWLSRQAVAWEKYRFEQLEFEYIPRVSAFADNGKSGTVAMQFDYDATDSPPSTKTEMLASRPNINDLPCKTMKLQINAREASKPQGDAKFVRSGRQPPGTDLKLYDAGKLHIASDGQATAGTHIGELHVRYVVAFEVPELPTLGLEDPRDLFYAYSSVNDTLAQVISETDQIGALSVPLYWNGNTINTLGASLFPFTVDGITIANAGIKLPMGNYMMDIDLNIFTLDYLDKILHEVWLYAHNGGSFIEPGTHWEQGEVVSGHAPVGAPEPAIQYVPVQKHLRARWLVQVEDGEDLIAVSLHVRAHELDNLGELLGLVSAQLAGTLMITPI